MFILFGLKTVEHPLPGRPATCQRCGRVCHHGLEERATRLTLFLIPVFTTSRSYRIMCSNCGTVNTLTRRQKNSLSV
ncbi:zinc-ribbon domain-containing protein [Arthrobacter sp. PsM3]|uniref:zinc-ribbon domain-containing protein n=1 Tax=Arthrobacter sp. PsM3 TaxID=3030531 RepID=UPI00263B4181|nr:zinc-ribbon domain-containing protein [Arthrobacter sp. PsM3]MDN4644373.1 zinc-ribbon domain-containing protein [Arthrobacter sp. PsM3]